MDWKCETVLIPLHLHVDRHVDLGAGGLDCSKSAEVRLYGCRGAGEVVQEMR